MGLSEENIISERTLTRGQFIFRRFGRPAVTLGVLTDKLPNTSGLARGQIDQDLKGSRAIQKAQGPVSAAGTAQHEGGVRGHGTHGASAPRGYGAVAGFSSPRAPPAGFAPLAAGGWRGGAAATKPVMLPLLKQERRRRWRRRQRPSSAAVQPRFVINRQF